MYFLNLEKTGTGGSAFRLLYGEFLKEIRRLSLIPNIDDLININAQLSVLYKQLAKDFLKIYKLNSNEKGLKGDTEKLVQSIKENLRSIEEKESLFWLKINELSN